MGNLLGICCNQKSLSFSIPKEKSSFQNKKSVKEDPQEKKKSGLKIDDFINKRKLGEGSYGKVFLVENKKNGCLYALKKIKKERLLKNDLRLKDVLNEKKIMLESTHPFIVKLVFTFQDKKYLYYGMEYV